ncbi:hypothetical protein [Kingella oralis]|jgi:hypothetical protein
MLLRCKGSLKTSFLFSGCRFVGHERDVLASLVLASPLRFATQAALFA